MSARRCEGCGKRTLLRAAAATTQEAGLGLLGGEGAPGRAITRPDLSRARVGLSCLHAAPRPGQKGARSVPCFACAEGRPPDTEVLEAVLGEMAPEDAHALVRRVGVPGLLEEAEELPAIPLGVDVCAVRHARLVQTFGPRYRDDYAVDCDGCGSSKGAPCTEGDAEDELGAPGLAKGATAMPDRRQAAGGAG